MPVRFIVVKPGSVNVTVYGPGRRSTIRYRPCASVTTDRTCSIKAGLLASMVPILTLAADGTDRLVLSGNGAYVVDHSALVLKAQPKPFDLDHLNLELSAHLGRLRVVPGKQGFNWTWAEADPAAL